MAAFDPAAATAAYMATLSPAGHAKATAYTHGGYWLLLWGWLVTVVAAWLIVRSGLLVRAETALERRKPRLVLVSMALAAIFEVVNGAIGDNCGALAGNAGVLQLQVLGRCTGAADQEWSFGDKHEAARAAGRNNFESGFAAGNRLRHSGHSKRRV